MKQLYLSCLLLVYSLQAVAQKTVDQRFYTLLAGLITESHMKHESADSIKAVYEGKSEKERAEYLYNLEVSVLGKDKVDKIAFDIRVSKIKHGVSMFFGILFLLNALLILLRIIWPSLIWKTPPRHRTLLIPLVVFFIVMAIFSKKENEEQTGYSKREKQINSLINTWNGSFPVVVDAVKKGMHDPGSFEHINSVYRKGETSMHITMQFRGSNAFGAKVINTVVAEITYDGTLISIN